MGKSLITRLNASVNRDDLPVLGKIRINITGTNNTAQHSGVSGTIVINGSALTWKGTGKCTINTLDNITYQVSTDKTSKGILFVDDKYKVKSIDTAYAHGSNVSFEDINKYCKGITALTISNSEQDGDLSVLKDLSKLESLYIGGSKITGDLSNASYLSNIKSIDISNSSISCDMSIFANSFNLLNIDVSNTSSTGDLSVLATLNNIISIAARSTTITGDLSSFANKASFRSFTYWELKNTWSSDSLRPSSMSKITGAFGFKTAVDTDNFLKNMAKCSDEDVHSKVWYFQNSHRTHDSDAAVSTLQNAGYTLSQLITD